jgi:hypothetical protein
MTPCPVDPCVFLKIENGVFVGALHTHVDDNIYFGSAEVVKGLKAGVEAKYPQVDQGPVKYVLGLEVIRDRSSRTLLLHQHEYIAHLLNSANMRDCNPIDTPAESNLCLTSDMSPQTEEERDIMDKIPYREVVGALLYLATCTRPDIAYAVGRVCAFTANPGLQHWYAVKRILRYLKGTANWGIVLGSDALKLMSYSDADWAGDKETRKSTSGFLMKLGSSSVSWKTNSQKCVTLSSFSAETVALVTGAQYTIWGREFLRSIGRDMREPTAIHEDNNSTIATLNGKRPPNQVKHIGVRFEWLKEKKQNGDINVVYCNTNDQRADIFTKALGRNLFQKHRDNPDGLNMKSADKYPISH